MVTLTGKRFTKRDTTVRFGGVATGSFVSVSAQRIEVRVPAGTPKGRVRVTVTTLTGRSAGVVFTRL